MGQAIDNSPALWEQKKELRRLIASLKREHRATALCRSREIMERLEHHPVFQASDTVLLYHSLPDEVNTHEFVERWGGRKQLLLPVVVGDDLELRRYDGPSSMQVGAYGILEPVGENFTDYAAIGFVAVPGVAFDARGNRLGRGKGYYDRLLPRLTAAYKAGICFSFQLLPAIPTAPFDIRMDGIVTERQCW
ncbi:MAG: 5-formyltetrahydrofolate cyclo-ligase [Bacteroides sp.]|nr:5-formyltetrahydrofolate cyclo-ligase [Bacteroides sp.]